MKRSFVIPSTSFTQVDATHWTLDVSALTGGAFGEVRDVCLFVPGGGLLPLDAGLALHVQSGASGWEYRGAVSNAVPSEVLPTAWPRPEGGDGYYPTAQVGVSVEPLVRRRAAERSERASVLVLFARSTLTRRRTRPGGTGHARGDGGCVQAGVREARGY